MKNDNNNDDEQKPQVMFVDGCFDNLPLTEAEITVLMNEITEAMETGDFGDFVVIQADGRVIGSNVASIDDYAQELSVDYIPKK
jgi:hypothetical protein